MGVLKRNWIFIPGPFGPLSRSTIFVTPRKWSPRLQPVVLQDATARAMAVMKGSQAIFAV